ncbi:MAG: sugar phosphate isomerase/epimerase [Chitinophagaceae bacterium]|nr:MAG: sugar phosphate isomerase/epimerase [Chitinophagaceae bacterium]
MKQHATSRRKFIATALTLSGAMVAPGYLPAFPAIIRNLGKPNSVFNGVQVGVISYSWRSMPSSAEQILKYCVDCNISAIELMGSPVEEFAGAPAAPKFKPGQKLTPEQEAERTAYAVSMNTWRSAVPMTRFEQIRKMYKDAGVSIYAYKPSALGLKNSDQEIDYALRAARALGANQVTVELPGNTEQTKRLGELALKHKIFVGYHGHLQQTISAWDEALQQSSFNAMNFDMGHYVAAGFDPMDLILKKHKHIVSMHVKDRKSKLNGGENVNWGDGDTPIVQALRVMRKNKYRFPATIELEYPVPEGSDAVKETAKCLEFARKALV